jgi:hypothetical protein
MTSNQPPTIARWLLIHFGCSPDNDAVVGDLDERYDRDRADAWYWRQVTVTLFVGFFKEIWNHKRRAMSGVLQGWTAVYLCYLLLQPADYYFEELFGNASLAYYIFTRILPQGLISSYTPFSAAAITLTRLVLVIVAGAISGRIVGHFNAAQRKPITLSYALSIPFVGFWLFVYISLTDITANVSLAWPILAITFVLFLSVLHGGRFFGRSATLAQPR